jgi:hypothetical protein
LSTCNDKLKKYKAQKKGHAPWTLASHKTAQTSTPLPTPCSNPPPAQLTGPKDYLMCPILCRPATILLLAVGDQPLPLPLLPLTSPQIYPNSDTSELLSIQHCCRETRLSPPSPSLS